MTFVVWTAYYTGLLKLFGMAKDCLPPTECAPKPLSECPVLPPSPPKPPTTTASFASTSPPAAKIDVPYDFAADIPALCSSIVRYLQLQAKIQEEDLNQWNVEIHLSPVAPVIQNGPSCGFAAVQMAGSMLERREIQTSSQLPYGGMLEYGRQLGFTQHGEMFSAANILHLLKRFFVGNFELRRLEESSGIDHLQDIVEFVKNDGCIILPYDKGPNHEPVDRKGHNAHWGVILGVASCWKTGQEPPTELTFAICRHGKSAHYGVWSLHDLLSSCLGLREFGLTKLNKDYVIGDPTDLADLRGTFILVHHSNSKMSWTWSGCADELISAK